MASTPAPETGRPSSFTAEIADVICEALAEGRSLRSVCLDDGMPNKATVFRWLAAHESFRDQYARAREAQADSVFDEILDIADDGSNDWMERHDDEGGNIGWRENGEALNRSKIRIDARKWMAGKLRPKVYGDKLDVTSSDGSMSPPTLADFYAGQLALPAPDKGGE